MPSLDPTVKIRRRPAVLSAEVAGEIVLMSAERGRYYGLDETGTDVWRRLESPVTIDELCAALAADYVGDPQAIAGDVVALLEELAEEGLVESVAE